MKFGRFLVLAFMVLWASLCAAQTVPGRFPPGTVYGNPNATGGADAQPSTVTTFATRWTTAQRPGSPAQGAWGFNTNTGILEYWDGATWASAVDGTVNVKAFGALGNGASGTTTGDNAAINNAIAYAKALGTSSLKPVKILFPPAQYVICDSINMTGWVNVGYAVTLSGYGAIISTCNTFVTGKPIIDMMGSNNLRVEGIYTFGGGVGGANSPSTGIQFGRTANSQQSGEHSFKDIGLDGVYQYGAMYNLASETNTYWNIKLRNENPNATTSGLTTASLIMDGQNHYNLTTVASGGQTIPVDTHNSFIGNNFIGGEFISIPTSHNVPLWITGDAENVSFKNIYFNTNQAACAYIYSGATLRTWNWEFEATNCEGANVTSYFFFTGTSAGPAINNLRLYLNIFIGTSSASVFKRDTGVTAVTLTDMDVRIAKYSFTTATVFDTPSAWSASGRYTSSGTTQWNQPATWSGCIILNLAQTCTPQTWTTAGRPASPTQGTFGFNTDIDTLESSSGLTQVLTATVTGTAGAGCVPSVGNTITVTGTSGTGQKFAGPLTVTAGAISLGTLVKLTPPGPGPASPGSYSVNPTLTNTPITVSNGTCTTAPQLNLTMGNVWNTVENSVVNVLDFGCVGNDTTRDESVCINNAISYAHGLGAFGANGFGAAAKIYFPPRIFYVDHPINLSGWGQAAPIQNNRGPAVTVDGYGAYIWAKNSFDPGKAVVDMMGSGYMRINGLTIYANNNTVNAASTGLQLGVADVSGFPAGGNTLNDVSIMGSYIVAALYNLGSEGMTVFNGNFRNDLPSAAGGTSAYVVVLDGTYHFSGSITSTFVTITTTPNQHNSNTDISFFGGGMTVQGSTATPLYVSGDTEFLLLEQVYLNTVGTRCIQINWDNIASINRLNGIKFNVHCEAGTLTNTFEFTGAFSRPVIRNFEYSDDDVFGTLEIFKIGTGGITGADIHNINLKVGFFVTGSAKVFDDPTKYSVSGNVSLPSATNWNQPAIWSGCTFLALVNNCTNSGVSFGSNAAPIGLQSAAVAVSGTSGSYVPGDRLTISGGTAATAAILALNKTQVRTATVQTAGTTCANVSTTLTGVSGTGTKWTYTTIVSGNTIPTGAITLTTNGDYSVNPTLTSGGETVVISGAGASCSVAPTITLTMGALFGWPVVPGNYSVAPTGTTVAVTGGSGTGATWTPTWSFVPAVPIDPSLTGDSSLNTSYGISAGASITSATSNTFMGNAAGVFTTTGNASAAMGQNALRANTTGAGHTCIGTNACNAVTTANFNTGIGNSSLLVATGANNVAVGAGAGNKITTGAGGTGSNLILGPFVASTTLQTGINNILLGTANNCDTTAAGTNNQFKVCAASGATDLMVGDMTAASLNLAMGGGLQLKPNSLATINGVTCNSGAEGKMFGGNDTGIPHTIMYCDGTQWTAFEPAMAHVKYVANWWYLPDTAGVSAAGATTGVSSINCTYEEIITPVTINTVGTNVTTAAVTLPVAQIAIYKADGTNGRPGTFLSKTADITVSATGVVSGATLNAAGAATNIQVGLGTTNGKDLWFCTNHNSSGPGVAFQAKTASLASAGVARMGSATQANVTGANGTQIVFCTGAGCQGGTSTYSPGANPTWPAALGTSTWVEAAAGNAPRIGFKVVSSP